MRPKRVLSRLMSGSMRPDSVDEVAAIDSFVDESLLRIDTEEPSLSAYLANPVVTGVHRATAGAMAALIQRDQKNGVSFAVTLGRLSALSRRAAETIALGAVSNDRSRP